MKVRLAASALFATGALLGSATATAEGSATVLIPACGNSSYGGVVAPRTWDYGCTEQTDLLRARWRDWGRSVSTAQGLTRYSPDVVRFPVVVYPVHVVAWRIRRCADVHHRFARYYTRVRLTFTLRRPDYLYPSGHVVRTDTMLCRAS